MSNIIPFPKNRALGDELRLVEKEKIEKQLKAGGQAYKNLKSWRGRIPPEDRVQLGKNMNRLIAEYKVKPNELDYGIDYQTPQAFRVDVHRMRVKSAAVSTRDLVASPYKWLRLLSYIHKSLRKRRLSVTLEYLADRLTRVTSFHPTKKELSRAEQQQILLSGWANKVNNEFNLLQMFSEISVLRAEYFKRNYCDFYDPHYMDWGVPSKLLTTFKEERGFDQPISVTLLERPMGELTAEEWETILAAIPEDELDYYQGIKDEILEWKRPFDASTSMWGSWRNVAFDQDIAVLPHWFIGFNAFTDLSTAQLPYSDPEWTKRLKETGTGDPHADGSPVDWEWDCSYLVLYPEEGFTRLVPYIFRYAAEGTTFLPLGDEDLAEYGEIPFVSRYFPPKPANELAIARTLLVRLEESSEEVLESWRRTAPTLQQHPYLIRKREHDVAVGKAIEKLMSPNE